MVDYLFWNDISVRYNDSIVLQEFELIKPHLEILKISLRSFMKKNPFKIQAEL